MKNRKYLIFVNFVAIASGMLIGYAIRFSWQVFPYKGIAPLEPYIQFSVFSAIVWSAMLHSNKIYRGKKFINPCLEFSQIIQSSFYSGVIISAITFFYRGFSYSRIAVILGIFISFALISMIYLVLSGFSASGDTVFLLIGNRENLRSIVKRLMLHGTPKDRIIFCQSEKLEEILAEKSRQLDPESIYVIVCLDDIHKIQEIGNICSKYDIHLLVYPKDTHIFLGGGNIEEIDGIPFITTHALPLESWHNRVIKRFFDIVLSILFLTVSIPLLITTAIFIKLSSPGPVFFIQERIGYKNRRFKMVKFRTMKFGSENILPYTIENDTRITGIGKLLRAFNIDELPQFFNVLKSDMSIVGPRPISTKDRGFFLTPGFNERMKILPGMTGWAQVHGLRGGQIEPEERFRYDLYYAENWSIWLDFAIIVFTLIPLRRQV